jgi:hypothetical protein
MYRVYGDNSAQRVDHGAVGEDDLGGVAWLFVEHVPEVLQVVDTLLAQLGEQVAPRDAADPELPELPSGSFTVHGGPSTPERQRRVIPFRARLNSAVS